MSDYYIESTELHSQSNHICRNVLVGQPAPDFCAPVVLADGSIQDEWQFFDAIRNKYALVFFYPLDFTFVCPSELIALEHRMEEFKKRNVEVIGVSIDSHFTHSAWRNTPIQQGGIGHVHYTLVADIDHKICRDYGIEHPENRVAFRAGFVIDSQGIVRAQIVNDLPIGRNIDEFLRLFDAVQFHERHGEVCPAGWQTGEKGMVPTSEGVANFLSEESNKL